MSDADKQKIHLICHCGYPKLSPEDEQYKQIKRAIENSGCTGSIITEFLTGEKLVRLRCCCDVMFNLQKTDAMSASMQENLAARGIVVVGEWLNYAALDDNGVYYNNISDFSEIKPKLEDIINNFDSYHEKTTENPQKIYSLLSWKPIKNDWLKALSVDDSIID